MNTPNHDSLIIFFILAAIMAVAGMVSFKRKPAKLTCPICGGEQEAGKADCDQCGCPM